MSLGRESPYIISKFNLLNTDIPLIQTLSMVPSVAVLTGLDCNHNKGCFSFAELTAKSCIKRTGFPLKFFLSDGCGAEQNISEYCNTWSGVMENAILPKPMLGGTLLFLLY